LFNVSQDLGLDDCIIKYILRLSNDFIDLKSSVHWSNSIKFLGRRGYPLFFVYCKLFLFTVCSFIIQEAKIKKDRQKVTNQSAESIAGKWIEIIKKTTQARLAAQTRD